jgi:fucose permease
MHFLHFCSSAGAFIGPLLAKNFLDHADVSHLDAANATAHFNVTHTELDSASGTRITTLFPITGLIVMIVNVGYAFLAVREIVSLRRSRTIPLEKAMNEEQSVTLNDAAILDEHEQQDKRQRLRIWAIYALVFVYMFFYVAVEFNVASFLPTFAVKCELRLSKAEGANLMAIFMGAYATTRLLFTFAAAKLKPNQIFAINLTCCLIGNLGIIALGEHYLLAMQARTWSFCTSILLKMHEGCLCLAFLRAAGLRHGLDVRQHVGVVGAVRDGEQQDGGPDDGLRRAGHHRLLHSDGAHH